MKIQHISNSFINIKTRDAHIVCDPWVGIGNHGGWHSYPEYSKDDLISLVREATHVYISHLHSDHLDLDFILQAKLLGKVFVIKHFPNGVMKSRLRKIGVEKIIEIEPFTVFKITEHTNVSIVPQMTSNTAGADDAINYDLDTSLVVNDQKFTFFNQVDNPLSIENFKFIKNFIASSYGEVDIACFVCGAASEYPQCFLNIDKESEKRRVINASLSKIEKTVEIFSPKLTFIAGGAYFIPGKFHSLNKFIAQPSLQEIAERINAKTTLVALEGGKEIDLSSSNPEKKLAQNIFPKFPSIEESISSHRNDLYPHQLDKPLQAEVLKKTFNDAKENYKKKLRQLQISIERKIIFNIHENLELLGTDKIKEDPAFFLELEPALGSVQNTSEIVIHIDNQAFWNCLTKKASWNQTLSGSLCLYERRPNTHEPEVLFSLNYLVV